MNSPLVFITLRKPPLFCFAASATSAERRERREKRGEPFSGGGGREVRRRRGRRRRRGGRDESFLLRSSKASSLGATRGEEEKPSSSDDDDDESDDGKKKKKKKKKNRVVKITVKGEEVIRYAIPNFFPDLNDVAFEPEETIEEIGRRRPPEEEEEEEEEKKIYVWKRGMELEEKKVVRENQAKIDALYNPPSALKTTSTTREEKRERREETKDILGKYAKAKEEETRETPSMASRALLFATVFAYALGLVLTTHRGVVDLSTPAPMECEAGDAACTKETLPKRVEVFVSLDE
jgi:hypothetical protein